MRYVKPMLRTCSRIVALTAMVAAPSMMAHAADTTLTLACQGTATDITGPVSKRRPALSTGIIIDLMSRTITISALTLTPLKITEVDEAVIEFEDTFDNELIATEILGSIDRVTGELQAIADSKGLDKRVAISERVVYILKCKPQQRMF
jgi:hypothetical protein